MHELSVLATTLNKFFTERRTYFLTVTEVAKATHGFKHSVAMGTKNINTKAVIFLLSACCKEALNFIFWSCSLKTGHDPFFKAPGFVLSMPKSTIL